MSGPSWKKLQLTDYKFDYLNLDQFRHHSCGTWTSYAFVFGMIAKAFAVYAFDIQTAVFLLAYTRWNSDLEPPIPFNVSKWLFCGCIFFSFLLLLKDWWDGRRVIVSRDISLAFTNIVAHRWFTCKGYSYHCLFCRISKSDRFAHSVAFFVFFSFKGWKRMIVAEGPRQAINAMTLYTVAKQTGFSTDFSLYYTSIAQAVTMVFMLLSLLIWAASMVQLIVAALLYLPLLCCVIRGNLKEFVCHIVDLRISEIVAKNRKKRRMQHEEELVQLGLVSSSGSTRSSSKSKPMPTLPQFDDVNLYDSKFAPQRSFTEPFLPVYRPASAPRANSVPSQTQTPPPPPSYHTLQRPSPPPFTFQGRFPPPAGRMAHREI